MRLWLWLLARLHDRQQRRRDAKSLRELDQVPSAPGMLACLLFGLLGWAISRISPRARRAFDNLDYEADHADD